MNWRLRKFLELSPFWFPLFLALLGLLAVLLLPLLAMLLQR